MALEQPLLLDLPREEGDWMMEPSSPSHSRLRGLRSAPDEGTVHSFSKRHSAHRSKRIPAARPVDDTESQETNSTLHAADSCASTEGSSVMQDSRPTKLRAPAVAQQNKGLSQYLNIIEESKEWGAMASSEGMSEEVHSPAKSASNIDPNLVRCWNWCLFFLEMWISVACIGLCAARRDWCLCFLLALPHTLLVGIEVQLISRDWAKALFFKSIIFLVFGWLSCLPVMRARQCWKQRGMRTSLVDEIEAPSVAESARVDSHVMFVTNVPRIMVLLYASRSLVYTDFELSVLLCMVLLSLMNVLQAAVNFDYYASKWIRSQYEASKPSLQAFPFQFQVLHHVYRFCEIALRILTLVTVIEVLKLHLWFGVLQAVTLPLIWFAVHPEQFHAGSVAFLPTWVALMSLLAAVWLLEHCTRLQHRAVDIFMACKKGTVQEVIRLLDAGCDCNLRLLDGTGTTPLHVASGYGQTECVEVLLRRVEDMDGETALHKACRRGHARCIRALLHPAEDSPCVLRGAFHCILLAAVHSSPEWRISGDFLECAAQVNKAGQRPLQLLNGETYVNEIPKHWVPSVFERHEPDLKRSLSSQLASPTRSVSGELQGVAQSVFGQVVKNSESRFLVATSSTAARNLTGFLFSTGIGEQMAEVLDNQDTSPMQLTSLRTQGVLGAGAFGKVFKVLDISSAEVYALKLQRRDSTTKFAIREAQALHRSSHAFIVRLIHIFQTQSYYALLMELCDKSLNACILEHLDNSGQILGLPDDATKRYTACITLALEYLHKQRVVFRDLKPDNVLITFKDGISPKE
eukprot:g23817.t1